MLSSPPYFVCFTSGQRLLLYQNQAAAEASEDDSRSQPRRILLCLAKRKASMFISEIQKLSVFLSGSDSLDVKCCFMFKKLILIYLDWGRSSHRC